MLLLGGEAARVRAAIERRTEAIVVKTCWPPDPLAALLVLGLVCGEALGRSRARRSARCDSASSRARQVSQVHTDRWCAAAQSIAIVQRFRTHRPKHLKTLLCLPFRSGYFARSVPLVLLDCPDSCASSAFSQRSNVPCSVHADGNIRYDTAPTPRQLGYTGRGADTFGTAARDLWRKWRRIDLLRLPERNRTRLAREMFRVWPRGVDLNGRRESATS